MLHHQHRQEAAGKPKEAVAGNDTAYAGNHRHERREAFLLLDVSRQARQAGFHHPVAVTLLKNSLSEKVNLKATCGSGDDANQVITILLPEED